MSETDQPPEHIPGKIYNEGDRVIFRGIIYVAEHKTVVRPGLSKAWRREVGE